MAVDGADVIKAHLLEQRAAGQHAAGVDLGAPCGIAQLTRELVGQLLRQMAHLAVGLGRDQARQVGAHGAHRGRDRHVVVVEDDDQTAVRGPGVVHRLIGHTRRHGAVADDGDHVVVGARKVARHGVAERRRDRGRAVGGAEGIVGAFLAAGEARQTAALAQRAHAVAPPGQYLVRIGLVAHVPDHLVARRVEDRVQRHREFDDPEPGAEVASGIRDHVDHLAAQFIRQAAQILLLEIADVRRRINLVE